MSDNHSELDLESLELQQAYEAKEVQQFLKHRAVIAAFAATEAQIVRHWKAASDPLSREMCWHKLKAFQQLQAELRTMSERHGVLTVS